MEAFRTTKDSPFTAALDIAPARLVFEFLFVPELNAPQYRCARYSAWDHTIAIDLILRCVEGYRFCVVQKNKSSLFLISSLAF